MFIKGVLMKFGPKGDSVKEIEVSQSHFKLKTVALVGLIVIAAAAFAVFLVSVLNKSSGWTTVEANNEAADCSGDFVFEYCLGESGVGATAEYKSVEALYSLLTKKAYRMFNEKEDFDDVVSLHYIYTHPGEEITVDAVLYSALETVLEGERYIYLAPLYDEYYRLFFGYEVAHIVEESDPYVDAEFAGYLSEISEFAKNPDHISLELLGENRVILHLSEEYKNFADENEITVLLDFFRMKNAFIIDYIADEMIKSGHTYGSITSFEGYIRNLDSRQNGYALNIFDRAVNTVYPAAKMAYDGNLSGVFLRSYPMGEQDSLYFYTSTEGKIIPPYIGEDGLYRTAAKSIFAYSSKAGCAEIITRLMPLYTAASLDISEISRLAEEGIDSLCIENREILCTDGDITLAELYDDGSIAYTVRNIK